MSVHSYFELATTVIGWHIANSIAYLLATSGLVFLPFIFLIYRNWAGPIKSQESKGAAPVSLRRMEHDVYFATVIVIFCFLPAVPINPSEIRYEVASEEKVVTAGDPNVPYMRTTANAGELRIPILWWLTYQVASILTNAATDAAEQLSEPGLMRPMLLRVGEIQLRNEQNIRELREFRVECYEPALAKFQNSNIEKTPMSREESVDWLGSHFFLNTPGYYKRCTNPKECGTSYHATTPRPYWEFAGAYHNIQPGKPYCDSWWAHPTLGLRSKILAEVIAASPWLQKHTDTIIGKFEDTDPELGEKYAKINQDRVLRRVTGKAPTIMANRPDNNKTAYWYSSDIFSIDGLQQLVGSLGALAASAVFHVIMELVIIGLPMIQALMLMLIYISIPLVVPYAVTNPTMIVRTVIILFAMKFVSALWALAAFLDEKLLETMYPDGAAIEYGGSGTAADVVLGLITLFSYITLPIAWFLLIGALSSSAVSSVANGWGNISQSVQVAAASGLQSLRKLGSGMGSTQ